MPVSIPAFSPAWADALRTAVNADADYRTVAANWTNPVALVVEPGTELAHGAAVQVDLRAGACVHADAMTATDVSAPYVLSAGLAAWKEILDGNADPISAVANGRVRLTRGSISVLMLNARAAKALLTCARQIETLWP